MDEKELAEGLKREGFYHTFVWEHEPGASYSDHTHETETAHVILDGEMTLTMDGCTATYHAEDRCDVPQEPCTRQRWGHKSAVI